jgi:hypothetical protein
MVEGRRHVAVLPLRHGAYSRRDTSPSLRDREETGGHDAVLAIPESIVGFSELNPVTLTPSAFLDPIFPPEEQPPLQCFIPSDGEGVGSTFLDDGGLWSSDEARATESAGVLAEVDGWPLLARRALMDVDC